MKLFTPTDFNSTVEFKLGTERRNYFRFQWHSLNNLFSGYLRVDPNKLENVTEEYEEPIIRDEKVGLPIDLYHEDEYYHNHYIIYIIIIYIERERAL